MRRRPLGWEPPGPVPPGPQGDPSLSPGTAETLDSLAGHWRIFQLRRGHRYSADDLVTAWWAVQCAKGAKHTPCTLLDLGCGIGSVMLLVLWRLPNVRAVGIEAQPASAGLARRSVRYNGVEGRAEVRVADFRVPGGVGEEAFDLVTGSPPYLVSGEGRRSEHPQRGACRFEDRGGLADYLRVAAGHLTVQGRVTWVHATRHAARALETADCVGLCRVSWRRVVFAEGKESLISVFSAERADVAKTEEGEPLIVRRGDGTWSDEYRALRWDMGFPA